VNIQGDRQRALLRRDEYVFQFVDGIYAPMGTRSNSNQPVDFFLGLEIDRGLIPRPAHTDIPEVETSTLRSHLEEL